MSRWKSPQAAAKSAERTAKEAEQRRKERRKERRKSWLLIVGVAVVSVGLVVADYFWLRHQARQRHEMRHKQPPQTNHPGPPPLRERNAPKTNEGSQLQ